MRCALTFELPEAKFPADSARLIVSFLKKSLAEYDADLYERLFGPGATAMKSYSYDIYYPNPRYQEGVFLLESPFVKLTFSSCDLTDFGLFYAAFANQKDKPHHWQGAYRFTLKEIKLLPQQVIHEEQLMIEFMSPLLVMFHDRDTGMKTCFTPEDETFNQELERVIKHQIETLAPHLTLDGFNLIPVKARRVVTKSYGLHFPATRGLFYLSGSRELLQFLHDAGIGNSRGAGYGLFKVI